MAMTFLPIVFLVLVAGTQTAYSIKCMECVDMPDPQDCTVTTECSAYETCHVTQFITTGGLILYSSGCMAKSRCSAKKREAQDVLSKRQERLDIPTCVSCCDTEYCNLAGCGITGLKQPQRGPVCFSCDSQSDPDKCRDVLTCSDSQVCSISQLFIGNQVVYTSKCDEKLRCQAFASLGGKRGIHERSRPCFKCCTDDFCNDDCGASAHLTTPLPSPTPPVSTTPKPTQHITTPKPTTHKPTQHITTQKPTTHKPVQHITTPKPTTHKPTQHITTQKPTTHKPVQHITTPKPTTHKPTQHITTAKTTTTHKPTHHHRTTSKTTTTHKPTHHHHTTPKPTTHKPTQHITTAKTTTTHKPTHHHRTTPKPTTTHKPTQHITSPTTTIPTTTKDPEITCKKDNYIFDSHLNLCLKFHTTPKMNWTNALHACEADNGTLAVITSPAKAKDVQNFITSHSHNSGLAYWVGGNDKTQAHVFTWLNGETIVFQGNDTVDMTQANCLFIDGPSTDDLKYESCTQLHSYICEKKNLIRTRSLSY